jgi:glycosyltransferase involved in cell wall biosynthesis
MLEHFANDPNVGLILKTNFGRTTPLDRRNVLQIINQITAECKKGPGPKIYVLHGHMTDEEMVDLYTHPKVKALLNLSLGEGFGLPILEAAACGLPVITTNWSAPLEFLGKGKFIKVDCSMQTIHPSRVDGQIFMQHAKWARVHEDDFKRKVKRFRDAPSIPNGWAKDLQQKLLVEYSPEAIQNQYTNVLKEVLDRP